MNDAPTPESREPAHSFEEPAPVMPSGESERRVPSLGQIAVGVILVLVGVGWLLEALDATDVPWRSLLPAALIVIGVLLMVGARRGRQGGLIALGVVLTLVLLLASVAEVIIDVPITGGVGEKEYRPTAVLESEYRWAIGSMTLDLREAELTPGETIEVSVAIGELVVILPEEAAFEIDARTGIGEIDVLGEKESGMGPDLTVISPENAELTTRLDLDLAIGRLEVRR
jgi:predicted membrane protein